MNQKKYQAYLENILAYLRLNFDDMDELMAAINEHEPEGRLSFDEEKKQFRLGMASWTPAELVEAMQKIRTAVIKAMDQIVADGFISEKELKDLHETQHDLVIQHVYDPDSPTKLNLNYIVPDGKIAWETGICPHCGEDVTIHLFPDPMPLLGYEAIINTLRLATRGVKLTRDSEGDYALTE